MPTTPILPDLVAPANEAFIAALEAQFGDDAQVLAHVPQGTEPFPPLVTIGAIRSEDASDKAAQAEQLTIEVIVIYRGEDRGAIAAIANRARGAIHRQPIGALTDDALLHLPAWLTTEFSDRPADGVTYFALMTFELLAEPV